MKLFGNARPVLDPPERLMRQVSVIGLANGVLPVDGGPIAAYFFEPPASARRIDYCFKTFVVPSASFGSAPMLAALPARQFAWKG